MPLPRRRRFVAMSLVLLAMLALAPTQEGTAKGGVTTGVVQAVKKMLDGIDSHPSLPTKLVFDKKVKNSRGTIKKGKKDHSEDGNENEAVDCKYLLGCNSTCLPSVQELLSNLNNTSDTAGSHEESSHWHTLASELLVHASRGFGHTASKAANCTLSATRFGRLHAMHVRDLALLQRLLEVERETMNRCRFNRVTVKLHPQKPQNENNILPKKNCRTLRRMDAWAKEREAHSSVLKGFIDSMYMLSSLAYVAEQYTLEPDVGYLRWQFARIADAFHFHRPNDGTDALHLGHATNTTAQEAVPRPTPQHIAISVHKDHRGISRAIVAQQFHVEYNDLQDRASEQPPPHVAQLYDVMTSADLPPRMKWVHDATAFAFTGTRTMSDWGTNLWFPHVDLDSRKTNSTAKSSVSGQPSRPLVSGRHGEIVAADIDGTGEAVQTRDEEKEDIGDEKPHLADKTTKASKKKQKKAEKKERREKRKARKARRDRKAKKGSVPDDELSWEEQQQRQNRIQFYWEYQREHSWWAGNWRMMWLQIALRTQLANVASVLSMPAAARALQHTENLYRELDRAKQDSEHSQAKISQWMHCRLCGLAGLLGDPMVPNSCSSCHVMSLSSTGPCNMLNAVADIVLFVVREWTQAALGLVGTHCSMYKIDLGWADFSDSTQPSKLEKRVADFIGGVCKASLVDKGLRDDLETSLQADVCARPRPAGELSDSSHTERAHSGFKQMFDFIWPSIRKDLVSVSRGLGIEPPPDDEDDQEVDDAFQGDDATNFDVEDAGVVLSDDDEALLDHLFSKKVWFAGHSLGGALATLGARMAVIREGAVDVTLTTLAAPRVLNRVAARRLENRSDVLQVFRAVTDGDFVPHVPISQVLGYDYAHVGRAVNLKQIDMHPFSWLASSAQRPSILQHHDPKSYSERSDAGDEALTAFARHPFYVYAEVLLSLLVYLVASFVSMLLGKLIMQRIWAFGERLFLSRPAPVPSPRNAAFDLNSFLCHAAWVLFVATSLFFAMPDGREALLPPLLLGFIVYKIVRTTGRWAFILGVVLTFIYSRAFLGPLPAEVRSLATSVVAIIIPTVFHLYNWGYPVAIVTVVAASAVLARF